MAAPRGWRYHTAQLLPGPPGGPSSGRPSRGAGRQLLGREHTSAAAPASLTSSTLPCLRPHERFPIAARGLVGRRPARPAHPFSQSVRPVPSLPARLSHSAQRAPSAQQRQQRQQQQQRRDGRERRERAGCGHTGAVRGCASRSPRPAHPARPPHRPRRPPGPRARGYRSRWPRRGAPRGSAPSPGRARCRRRPAALRRRV